MAAKSGRAVIITKDGDDLADELRTKTITFNGDLIDVTTDGDDGWMTTLDGVFAMNSVTLTLEGILKSDTIPDMAFSGAQEPFVITVGTLFTLTGTWQLQPGAAIDAPYNDAATFSGTLQSVGEVAKAAVT